MSREVRAARGMPHVVLAIPSVNPAVGPRLTTSNHRVPLTARACGPVAPTVDRSPVFEGNGVEWAAPIESVNLQNSLLAC